MPLKNRIFEVLKPQNIRHENRGILKDECLLEHKDRRNNEKQKKKD